jgi:hypothetical protein
LSIAIKAATMLAAGALAMGLPVASALAAEPAVGSQMVSDALGTHAAGQAELPDSGVAPVTAQADCTGSGSFGGYFNTYLGSGWTSLTARTGPHQRVWYGRLDDR